MEQYISVYKFFFLVTHRIVEYVPIEIYKVYICVIRARIFEIEIINKYAGNVELHFKCVHFLRVNKHEEQY